VRPFPFLGRPRLLAGRELVQAPEDLEPVIVGVAELDRYLRAGPPPALEIELHVVALQMFARAQHLVQGRHLEGDVIELVIGIGLAFVHRAHQRDRMVVRPEAQKGHAARRHVVGVDVRALEAHHLGIEFERALDIAAIDDDVPELADLERQILGRLVLRLQLFNSCPIERHIRQLLVFEGRKTSA